MRITEDFAFAAVLNLGNLFGCGETIVEHILIIANEAGVSAEFIIQFVLRVGKNIALLIESCRV